MFQNALRAARLDVSFYNEAERNTSLTGQAFVVVLIANLLAAVGTWVAFRSEFLGTLLSATIGAVIGWLAWSILALFIGRALGGTSDFGEMLRVIGFAQAPRAIGIIPFLGLIGSIWALIASVIAIREGQDFTTGKAILTVVFGWIAWVVLSFVGALIF